MLSIFHTSLKTNKLAVGGCLKRLGMQLSLQHCLLDVPNVRLFPNLVMMET